MKIALAQQNYHIGNFEYNTQKILEGIAEAKKEGAELVVFSELCVCGYPPRDFLEFNDFIEKCYQAIDVIKEHTDTIGVIVGCPVRNPSRGGKKLFNAAWVLHRKEVKAIVHKTLLPTYDVFDEYRYFEPAFDWSVVEFNGTRIALTICEDLWNLSDNPMYRNAPMDALIKQKPDIMINISASPFDYDHDDDRKEVIRANVVKYNLPLIYCNTVGSQTEIVFDGGSLVFDKKGFLVTELNYFEEDFTVVDTDLLKPSSMPITMDDHLLQIYSALKLGIRDYFQKMGFTRAIIGSSGGIDSAVTLAIACDTLGASNVRAVLMPSPYSSGHSVSDAEQLSINLRNPYDILPIKNIYESFLAGLKPLFGDLPFSVAEENIQSRTRGNLLMAMANKFGYILLNTSNKSELSTGYGTLYGDMAGGLSVLGDVYKTQVFALARYINRDKEIIPVNILSKAPSAELRPDQKDSDSLPEYELLDKVLYQYIENRKGPSEIIAMGMDPALVARILKLVNTSEYKRNQFCPIIRISRKAFGVGRRMPIVGKYLS